jgi:hypothetical protein
LPRPRRRSKLKRAAVIVDDDTMTETIVASDESDDTATARVVANAVADDDTDSLRGAAHEGIAHGDGSAHEASPHGEALALAARARNF